MEDQLEDYEIVTFYDVEDTLWEVPNFEVRNGMCLGFDDLIMKVKYPKEVWLKEALKVVKSTPDYTKEDYKILKQDAENPENLVVTIVFGDKSMYGFPYTRVFFGRYRALVGLPFLHLSKDTVLDLVRRSRWDALKVLAF